MSKNSVEKMLDEMDGDEQHQAILSFLQYPKTSKLEKDDPPILTCPYRCDAITCHFSDAKKMIKESTDLRAFGAQTFLEKVINDIERHQEDHMARQLDGFQIYRSGFDLVRLQRVDEDGKAMSSTRTGFIEYNDVQQVVFERLKRERQENRDKAFQKTTVDKVCTIM